MVMIRVYFGESWTRGVEEQSKGLGRRGRVFRAQRGEGLQRGLDACSELEYGKDRCHLLCV